MRQPSKKIERHNPKTEAGPASSFKLQVSSSRGFTLFELMVSVSIFVIITGISIINYRKFSNDIDITNLAYDVALTIRNSQAYGINVRGVDSSFDYAYGVRFARSGTSSEEAGITDDVSYVVFVDADGDGRYDHDDELVEDYRILKGNKITNIEGYTGGSYQSIDAVDITFLRPNPEAIIMPIGFDHVRITLESPQGRERFVVVYPTGQISVQ